jgi:hypothetical protein
MSLGVSTPLVTTASGRTLPLAPGRYKVMEPGPVPLAVNASADGAAPALATKIVPGAGPKTRRATWAVAAVGGEVPKPMPLPSRQPARYDRPSRDAVDA